VSPEAVEPGVEVAQVQSATTGAAAHGSLSEADVRRLITENYIGLRLLIARRTGDPEVAADLLNEALCTSWEKWRAGEIRQPQQIAGYVFQVAINLLRNLRRAVGERSDRRMSLESLEKEVPDSHASEPSIEDRIAHKVRELIQSLGSTRDRKVLVRFYLEEDDKETICRDLSLSPLQFDKVLHRARRRLKESLESHGLRGSDLLCALLCMI
jgi:RNA polymerase sigma-70 factor, ECF subfamily